MVKLDLDTASVVTARKPLSAAAQRALAEAAERRLLAEEAAKANSASPPAEIGGRTGPDPARYGDWEVKGIVSDF